MNYDLFPTRSHISALLKKLSLWPHHKAASRDSPWVVVEFSNQDLKCPDDTGRVNSLTSDQSLDMPVEATGLWREQAANYKNIQEQVYINFRWFNLIQKVHKFNIDVRIFRMVFTSIHTTQKSVQDKIMISEQFSYQKLCFCCQITYICIFKGTSTKCCHYGF